MAGREVEDRATAAVEQLEEGTSIQSRVEGLEGVHRLFLPGIYSHRIDQLSDDAFHRILEAVFRFVRVDKLKYAQTASKNVPGARLKKAAETLRTIVRVTGYRLKQKTASAVLDHIIGILPESGGGFLMPIQTSYLKTLNMLLNHASRCEHLRPKQWTTYVDFLIRYLLEGIEKNTDERDSTTSGDHTTISRNGATMSFRLGQSSAGNSQSNSVSTLREDLPMEEMLIALKYLACTSNAPIETRLNRIVEVTLSWLEVMKRSEELAFEILNGVLPVALSESIQLAANTLNEVCQIVHQRGFWTKRFMSLRPNILATMTLCRSLFLDTSWSPSLLSVSSMENLLELMHSEYKSVIYTEYEKASERERLQMEDFGFSTASASPLLSLKGIYLTSEAPRASNTWFTLSTMAFLMRGIQKKREALGRISEDEGVQKKRKLSDPMDDLFQDAMTVNSQTQLISLQLALFVINQDTSISKQAVSHLSQISFTDLEDDVSLASWTFLLLSTIANVKETVTDFQPEFWKKTWTWASRASASSAMTRPACYLLHTMTQSDIVRPILSSQNIVEGIFPSGASGPNGLSDAAILLLRGVLASDLLDTAKGFKDFANHTLRWLDRQWTISTVPDRLQNSQTASYARSDDLFTLLVATVGTCIPLESVNVPTPTNSVVRALLVDDNDLSFTHYMLSEISDKNVPALYTTTSAIVNLPPPSVLRSLKQLTIDVLGNKLKSFIVASKEPTEDGSTLIGLDIVEIMASTCAVASCISEIFASDLDCSHMKAYVRQLWEIVLAFLSDQSGEGLLKDAFVKAFTRIATTLTNIHPSDIHTLSQISICRADLSKSLISLFDQNYMSQGKTEVLDLEFEDSSVVRASQNSQQRTIQTRIEVERSDFSISGNIYALQARQNLMLKLDQARGQVGSEPNVSFGTLAVECLEALKPEHMLASRDIIVGLLKCDTLFTRADSSRLLTALAEVCLQDEEYERCEAALCLCLRVTLHLVPLWAIDVDDDLANVGFDIYQWFIETALGKNIASQHVLRLIATMLDGVLSCHPSYGTDTLASARTSLLKILRESRTGLKFQLLESLSHLFNGYVLSEHSAVFDDVLANLTVDPTDNEGIVLRLYIIANLGAQWHTVLRLSIYHIFDTAANSLRTAAVAAKCVHMVCEKLNLDCPRHLLRLFSSQIFYTWLEHNEMQGVPFGAFGYSTLKELQVDVQDELVALVAMRNSTSQTQQLVQCLETSWDGLIQRWFAKVSAYVVLSDVGINRTSRDIGKAEMCLLQQLGEDSYASLCRANSARAISTIFVRLSDDRGFEKVRGEDQFNHDFAGIYKLICARSASQIQLPPGLQPSFRAKYLLPVLDRMCMRSQETLQTIWMPALLVHVYRTLLTDAKPAFGPLHTCAVLRKLRIVVSLAGPVALSGYPLQMLLHSLRPFLTQFHSSEDAVGIVWYLLEYGRPYLKQKLPFVTGLGVSVFASLSRFASSSQESTTQESHFKSTMNKAQQFRLWLGGYLQDSSTTNLGEQATSTFANIVQAAKQITTAGSSARATPEGSLLYHLLADQASEQPLLPNSFFQLTLRSLCHDFTATTDFQDDILFDDADVLEIAPVLWSILKHASSQDAFRIWMSQALGRAYALQGPTIMEMDDTDRSSGTKSQSVDILIDDSYRSIVNSLGELLWNEDVESASAAEGTLQSIFSALPPSDKAIVLGTNIDQSTFEELRFVEIPCPPVQVMPAEESNSVTSDEQKGNAIEWASVIIKRLSISKGEDPVLSFLPSFMRLVPSMSPSLFAYVIHLALYFEKDQDPKIKEYLTETFEAVFDPINRFSNEHVQLALKCIVYLRRCVVASETSMAKRNHWLAVDYGAAAAAALRCGMSRTALLMLEIHVSQHSLNTGQTSRRSSMGNLNTVHDLLNRVYQSVDDPDFFYGTHEESDVASIVEKLCHEGHGYKALSFQSALFDSNIRTKGISFALETNGESTISALNLANLNGLASSVGSFMTNEHDTVVHEHSLEGLLNLHQWDITQERAISNHGTIITTALKTLSSAPSKDSIIFATDQSTLRLADLLTSHVHQRSQRVSYWTSLSVLAELKETLATQSADDLGALLSKRSILRAWNEQESFECIEPILLGREAVSATIKNNEQLRHLMHVSTPQALLLEVKTLRSSLSLGHVHEMSQFCLNRAAYLSELLPTAVDLGVKVEAAIQYDLANTFWAQQETAASIRILQYLHETAFPMQAIEVQKSEILTDLGSKIAEARLDRPDEVTAKYLIPAIEALGRDSMGSKVGRVFHNFAAFCDSQLRDPDNVDEYERIERIRDRKLQEVLELETMYRKGDSKSRDTVKAHFTKAKTWLKLDDEELQRLKAHRERLVRNCLENYLLSLRACQDFPNDVLRFLALWMEQSNSPSANSSVSKYLSSVATYKFAPLMNQLSSRILNEDSPFQHLLSDLMFRICEDHPFHSLYQIFATSKSRGAQKDEVANSRHAAAKKLYEKIMRKKDNTNDLWLSIHNTNVQFVRVAQEKIPDKEFKTGSKLLLRKLQHGAKLEQTIHDMHQRIPPPTMKLEIRPSKDYSSVPTIAKFDPQISIAGGVSAPKIITIVATDGSRHKMLLKGGNDDLRQDSIMEQVFEQVSHLLEDHRPTRQRKLGIRTYKVIPLTHNAGIIEFVKDTMPLHDYVLPAHTRYYPKDYKPNRCRKEIADSHSKSLNQRVQAYRNVVANFHPVLRFFFMEHFLDPDDWFQKRLNYSRSTAAISILGHVLGLGDRHGHNILLDTKTGEVVHIDLGVAFEAGRVLPIPEVVPFRLTRDLVDGMGLSGVEGVFRRCCNFTLEALRRNQEAIMTILDVLRWDPLYSWSVSPLRLARMQENQEQAANVDASTAGTSAVNASMAAGGDVSTKRNVNEPSEADRALAVVSKKLGKSLSVEATVNELIRQAMDEQNLAVLYCGWAAYA